MSHVNGQEYVGGQFTPEHGLFCGKGSARIKTADLVKVSVKLAMDGKRVEYIEAQGCWAIFATVKFADGSTGEQRQFSIRTAAGLKKLTGLE